MLQATPNASTTKFQLTLPSLLSSISPSLAALHATRARLLYPTDATLAAVHCVKCGYPFLASGSQTRSVRKKRKRGGDASIARVIRRCCRNCGHDEDVPLDTTSAPTFPKPRDRTRSESRSISQPRAASVASGSLAQRSSSKLPVSLPPRPPLQIGTSSTTAPSRSGSVTPGSVRATPTPIIAASLALSQDASSAQPDQARAKARPKKKTGLQNMLARNRERQAQETKRDGGQGLSAFLQGL